jgi:hypothetical protein
MRSSMDARSRVIGILVLWAIVFAASFIVPLFIPATCQSFLCGFNRIAYWFWLQIAGFVVTVVAAVAAQIGRAKISRRLLWMCRALLLISGAEMLAFAVLIVRIVY